MCCIILHIKPLALSLSVISGMSGVLCKEGPFGIFHVVASYKIIFYDTTWFWHRIINLFYPSGIYSCSSNWKHIPTFLFTLRNLCTRARYPSVAAKNHVRLRQLKAKCFANVSMAELHSMLQGIIFLPGKYGSVLVCGVVFFCFGKAWKN